MALDLPTARTSRCVPPPAASPAPRHALRRRKGRQRVPAPRHALLTTRCPAASSEACPAQGGGRRAGGGCRVDGMRNSPRVRLSLSIRAQPTAACAACGAAVR